MRSHPILSLLIVTLVSWFVKMILLMSHRRSRFLLLHILVGLSLWRIEIDYWVSRNMVTWLWDSSFFNLLNLRRSSILYADVKWRGRLKFHTWQYPARFELAWIRSGAVQSWLLMFVFLLIKSCIISFLVIKSFNPFSSLLGCIFLLLCYLLRTQSLKQGPK